MKYRPEIDGLRALAVIPVVLFHAGFSGFSGGFVGVDIFFVISGYLITTILLDDIETDRFSLLRFYERRFRRIVPALVAVALLCVPFAVLWLSPSAGVEFAQSLIALVFFASNIHFWRESGYFAPAAEEKPLLHTWSLAVEEQYYLVFPIFLIVTIRMHRHVSLWSMVLLFALSLGLSEWGWRHLPSANFYLTPTRVWELFAGSLAAMTLKQTALRPNAALALAGLIAILLSAVLYSPATPFPSLYTLLPVLGTVAIILFCGENALTACILSNKALVQIGLISYSTYLIHQPLFAFLRARTIGEPEAIYFAALSLASFGLGYLSWKYIEAPFRKPAHVSPRTIFTLTGVAGAGILTLGLMWHFTGGLAPYLYDAKTLSEFESARHNPMRRQCHFPSNETALSREPCTYFSDTGASVAVFGNSHATELALGVALALQDQSIRVQHHTMSSCRHTLGLEEAPNTPCHAWQEKVVSGLIADPEISHVVVSYRNEDYLAEERYRTALIRMLARLEGAGKGVTLVLQAPLPGADMNKLIQLGERRGNGDVLGMGRREWDTVYASATLLRGALPHSVSVIDPADYFCDRRDCLASIDCQSLYFDDNHMSVAGAKIIGRAVAGKLLHGARD